METHTESTPPAWALEYLRLVAWTHDECRNLLCGLPPVAPVDAPPRTRQEIADSFVRDELRRVGVDRHVRDAILVGHLKVRGPPNEGILEKVRPHLLPEEFEALHRAITHDRSCSKAYRVAPDEAIRWATSRPDLFPDFPFKLEHLILEQHLSPRGVEQADLKERRRSLLRSTLKKLGLPNQAAFCRANPDITPDILRAVVNGDSRRADVAQWTPKVLALLGVRDERWNNP